MDVAHGAGHELAPVRARTCSPFAVYLTQENGRETRVNPQTPRPRISLGKSILGCIHAEAVEKGLGNSVCMVTANANTANANNILKCDYALKLDWKYSKGFTSFVFVTTHRFIQLEVPQTA